MLPYSPLSAFHRERPINRLKFNIHKFSTSLHRGSIDMQDYGINFETRCSGETGGIKEEHMPLFPEKKLDLAVSDNVNSIFCCHRLDPAPIARSSPVFHLSTTAASTVATNEPSRVCGQDDQVDSGTAHSY